MGLSMLGIQGYLGLTTMFSFTKRGLFGFWPEVLLVRFYKLEDSVGQRVYVDMLVLACIPGDLIFMGLGHRDSIW